MKLSALVARVALGFVLPTFVAARSFREALEAFDLGHLGSIAKIKMYEDGADSNITLFTNDGREVLAPWALADDILNTRDAAVKEIDLPSMRAKKRAKHPCPYLCNNVCQTKAHCACFYQCSRASCTGGGCLHYTS
jgi:hypothetical protein